MLRFKLLVLSVALTFQVAAQTVLENNPSSLKWYQVNTPHFRILFPKGFEVQGQRMANTLEHIHAAESRSLGSSPKKISVILQNQSSISNGFVSVLPRRSEFYAMPSQDYNFTGTNDWLSFLASHEYRHIVQYQHARKGFNNLFYYLFGPLTFAGMSHVAVPAWFWEGDAVATETAFTHSGRGKIPNFSLLFKTNLLEGRSFNYHKQYLRSYKHNMPDHYVLGYHMVSYLRKRTNDPEIWSRITARSWSVPFMPLAFSNAIKGETGMYVTKLYREMAQDLKKQWQAELDTITLTPFTKVNKRNNRTYTDYLSPQPLSDGSVLVMKKGMSDIETFVVLKDGEEKKFTPGIVNDAGYLSSKNDIVVWNEFGYHPRWSVRNYSLIKSYDLKKDKKKVLTKRSRYASAALSPDGKRIVTIETDTQYKTSIVILDNDGNVLKKLANPSNYFYAMPSWSQDGKKITVLKTTQDGKTISVIDLETEVEREVLPVSQENVGQPILVSDYMLFNSPASGIDNIYAVNLKTSQRYKITNSRYGAYNPSVTSDIKTLYYNDQTKNGLDVVSIPFDTTTWRKIDGPQKESSMQYSHLVEQEGRENLFDSIPQQTLAVRKYSKLKGIFNPYTWGLNLSNTLSQINVGIVSQDLLSTTQINAGYTFDLIEKTGLWKAGVSYQGLFPIIDVSVTGGNRKREFSNAEFSWSEITAEGGIRIPLKLTRSKYLEQLGFGNYVGLTKVSDFKNRLNSDLVINAPVVPRSNDVFQAIQDQQSKGTLIYNHSEFSYNHVLKRSYRDFLYRWGQQFEADFFSTPYGGDYKANLFAARSAIYFPGLFRHHYLFGRLAYQKHRVRYEANSYNFRNQIFKPRGYSYPFDEEFYTLSANYALPLWYPDIALGPVLNIQRIKANLFADYGHGTGGIYYFRVTDNAEAFSPGQTYQSFGVETTFDFNFMRLLAQFEMGVRATYRKENALNTGGVVFEVIIGNIGF